MTVISNIESGKSRRLKNIIAIFAAAFFFIKFAAPLSVAFFYDNGNTDFLNRLAGGEGVQVLEYYQGRLEETVFGPTSSLIAGFVLILLSGFFLDGLKLRMYALAIFGFLLATKFEVLFWPTYGDTIGGVFAEAVWLLRHNFDYAALARQPVFVEGGPRVYFFSVYPGFLAVLMKLFPHAGVFAAVNHVLTFFCAAFTVAFFREGMARLTDRRTAGLLALILLVFPLFQSQAEAISMEIPALMFAVISVFYLISRDIRRASLYAIAASMIKDYAAFVCVTVFAVGFLLFFLDKENAGRRRVLFWSFAAGSFFIIKLIAAVFAFQLEDGGVNFIGLFEGWPVIRTMALSHIYVVCSLVFAGFFVRSLREHRVSARDFFNRHYGEIVCFLCTGAWFGLFVNSYAISPRYRLQMIPFFLACVYSACRVFIRRERVLQRLVIGGVLAASLCAYGMNYVTGCIHESCFERSLEYRNDLKLHMEIAHRVEEHYTSWTVAAPFTIAQFLAIPEMGYVTQPMDVVIYGFPCTYGGIRNFNGLKDMELSRTIWVGRQEPPRSVPFPVGPGDHILEEIYAGNRRGVLFIGGFAIERLWQTFLHLSRMGELRSSYDGRAVTIHEDGN